MRWWSSGEQGGISRRALASVAAVVVLTALAPLLVLYIDAPTDRGGTSPPTSAPQGAPDPAGAGPDDASPAPTTDDEPNTRLGLHVTSRELHEWRLRAQRGPYRRQGDVSPNSPGDWTRIADRAAAFLDQPDVGRWNGPSANNPDGCVRAGERGTQLRYEPPVDEASALRDAAFFALVEDSDRHAAVVADEIVAQARMPGVDFDDRSRWCLGKILDGNPGFMIATWLTKYLYAMDYLRIRDPQVFSPQQERLLNEWFLAAAELMEHDVNLELDELFVDREAGVYTPTETARLRAGSGEVLYLGGPEVKVLHRRYNNRMARLVRFFTLVGIYQNEQSLSDGGKRFVKEYVRFGYFPQGAVSDFERWTEHEPIKGWKYGAETVGAILTIADHLARAGDDELYRYATTDGALGSEGRHHGGGAKTLETLVTDLLHYVDSTFERYGTGSQRHDGDPAYLITTRNGVTGGERINDLQLVPGNWYFQNDYIRSVYTREASDAPPYPADPRIGSGDPESGEAGTYPGVLFMFGNMEDQIAPQSMPGLVARAATGAGTS